MESIDVCGKGQIDLINNKASEKEVTLNWCVISVVYALLKIATILIDTYLAVFKFLKS